jgi:hypothetical protein
MEKKERFEEIWNNINQNSMEFMDANFGLIAPILIRPLVTSLQQEKKLEIGIFEDGAEKGSNIKYSKSNHLKRLELRYKKDSSYQLVLNIYNAENTYSYYYKLTWEDIGMIPYHIHSSMREVEKTSEPKFLVIT